MKCFPIFCCAMLLATASGLPAQTRPGDTVVDVPFSFQVNGQPLPAGHYIVARFDTVHVRISSATRNLYVATHGVLRNRDYDSKLVFHRYGETYFLTAIWVMGNSTGRELARSAAERALSARKSEMELAVVRPTKPPSAK